MSQSRERVFQLLAVLILLFSGSGLLRDLTEPWVGMHDWNGAFFSQLARNFIRYPASVHHGMPIVALGEDVPAAAERCLYATHPPGLVWLVAGAFKALGDSEASARWVPILFSLTSLALFVWLAKRACGWATALTAGSVYSSVPMLVYFGRMVDHEAICLACMLACVATWSVIVDANAPQWRRRFSLGTWMVAILIGVWVDWSMVLFAGLFCAYLIYVLWRAKSDYKRHLSRALFCIGWAVLCVASMLVFLVEAGLVGRWNDLVAIFLSRSTEAQGGAVGRDMAARGGVGQYTIDNLTWPVIILAGVGLVAIMTSYWNRREKREPLQEVQRSRQTAEGLFLVALTGVIWLAIFWRQYERHNYWLFYLGPAAALLAGSGLVAIWSRMSVYSRPMAWCGTALILVATLFFEIQGTKDYFQRLSYPPEEVDAWKSIHAMTQRGDRILLFRNPLRIEDRGGYRFRNIVPPHLAYYLDRAFDVEPDLRRIPQLAASHALFVMPVGDAARYAPALASMQDVFRVYRVGNQLVIDLREH